jgi:hypothetical protein
MEIVEVEVGGGRARGKEVRTGCFFCLFLARVLPADFSEPECPHRTFKDPYTTLRQAGPRVSISWCV